MRTRVRIGHLRSRDTARVVGFDIERDEELLLVSPAVEAYGPVSLIEKDSRSCLFEITGRGAVSLEDGEDIASLSV